MNNAGERVTLIGVADANADCRAGDVFPGREGDTGSYVPSMRTTAGTCYLATVTYEMAPKCGYWYGLMKFREEGGTVVPYDKEQSVNHYGLVAFPDDYGQSGESTFCISEEGTVYTIDMKKATGYIDTLPADPVSAGWEIPQ